LAADLVRRNVAVIAAPTHPRHSPPRLPLRRSLSSFSLALIRLPLAL
jgi:hypothetical protein